MTTFFCCFHLKNLQELVLDVGIANIPWQNMDGDEIVVLTEYTPELLTLIKMHLRL